MQKLKDLSYTILFWGAIIIIFGWIFSKVDWSKSGEPYDPDFDPRIENCGPGGTYC